MLVLSRKENERVVIGNGEVQIVVVELRPDKVRLGFDAPADVPVHRSEVFDAIRRTQGVQAITPGGKTSRPVVETAGECHLLLRFRSPSELAAAVRDGRVSFAVQEA